MQPREPLLCLLLTAASLAGQDAAGGLGDCFEAEVPCHGATVDGRRLGTAFPADNLVPRGLVLRAGPRGFVCFDTDLLRPAVVWLGAPGQSNGITLVGMAAGSYRVEGRKAAQGRGALPQPLGRPLLATGAYPGWQARRFRAVDPRPPAPDPSIIGRGPLDPAAGRFEHLAWRAAGDAALVYRLGAGHRAVRVTETWAAAGPHHAVLWRTLQMSARADAWVSVVADFRGLAPAAVRITPDRAEVALGGDRLHLELVAEPGAARLQADGDGRILLRVAAGPAPVTVRLGMIRCDLRDLPPDGLPPPASPARAAGRRWPQEVTTHGLPAADADRAAYVVDRVPLPVPNPWRRRVRAAGIDFLPDGRAAVVTFDGDVWLASGLQGDLATVRWRRFAAGLHEPQALRVVDGAILVFARTGILRLRDRDGDGEADHYENFCNAFAQSAETREFAMDLDRHPDGSLFVAKGGQQIGGASHHGGTILRIAADGRRFEVWARGLREPFLAVHPATGQVTASDQQGNWVPTTPVLVVGRGDDFGFRDPARYLAPGEHRQRAPTPSRAPLCWIPHAVLKSASSQVWATGGRFGPFDGRLLQFGYYDPSLFVVLQGRHPGAAAVRLPLDFRFPPLDGRMHPGDGSLFLTGFRIWGTESVDISGLVRVRHTGRPTDLPIAAAAWRQGVLLRFDAPLDPTTAVAAGRYVVQRWQYRRSARYGSGHFRRDGQPGQEALPVTAVHLASDRRAVFLRVDDLQPVMQMAVRYELAAGGRPRRGEVYLTPTVLPAANLPDLGFTAPPVAAAPAAAAATAAPSAAQGARLFATVGCAACHATDGTTVGKVGPSLAGVFGSRRPLTEGPPATADAAYLRRSILAPHRQVVAGHQAVMPSYEGVLTGAQVESLVLFLRTLAR